MKMWNVLRCQPAQTLKLAHGIADLDGESFTPVVNRLRRRPRSMKRYMAEWPVMLTYVFVERGSMELALNARQRRLIPSFSVMRVNDKDVLVRDNQLDPLRQIANMGAAETQLNRDLLGRSVQIKMAAFGGISAKVIEQKANECLVELEGFADPIKIHPFLLVLDEA